MTKGEELREDDPESGTACPICKHESMDYGFDPCEHLLVMFDRTFPYAGAWCDCPYEPQTDVIDPSRFSDLNEAVSELVTAVLKRADGGKKALDALPGDLEYLVSAVLEEARFEGDELVRDAYADLHAFEEYLEELISSCKGYSESTRYEQNIPLCSSAYSVH